MRMMGSKKLVLIIYAPAFSFLSSLWLRQLEILWLIVSLNGAYMETISGLIVSLNGAYMETMSGVDCFIEWCVYGNYVRG